MESGGTRDDGDLQSCSGKDGVEFSGIGSPALLLAGCNVLAQSGGISAAGPARILPGIQQ